MDAQIIGYNPRGPEKGYFKEVAQILAMTQSQPNTQLNSSSPG